MIHPNVDDDEAANDWLHDLRLLGSVYASKAIVRASMIRKRSMSRVESVMGFDDAAAMGDAEATIDVVEMNALEVMVIDRVVVMERRGDRSTSDHREMDASKSPKNGKLKIQNWKI